MYIMLQSSDELNVYCQKQSCKTELTPLKLLAHLRTITSTKFNRDGTLLFTTSKDRVPIVWDTETGKKIGTYNGHDGAVLSCSVNDESTLLATASMDQKIIIWNISDGVILREIEHEAVVRDVYFGKDNKLSAVTDDMFKQIPAAYVYQISSDGRSYNLENRRENVIKINKIILGVHNGTAYFCCEDGSVNIWNLKDDSLIKEIIHPDYNCKSIKLDPNGLTLLTGSSDQTAKLLNINDLSVIRTYINPFPINDIICVNNNIKEHVITGGGVAAADVTTSSNRRFDIIFYSKPLEDRLGSFSCHFGPVTSLNMTLDGTKMVSGSEDGYVYIYKIGGEYAYV